MRNRAGLGLVRGDCQLPRFLEYPIIALNTPRTALNLFRSFQTGCALHCSFSEAILRNGRLMWVKKGRGRRLKEPSRNRPTHRSFIRFLFCVWLWWSYLPSALLGPYGRPIVSYHIRATGVYLPRAVHTLSLSPSRGRYRWWQPGNGTRGVTAQFLIESSVVVNATFSHPDAGRRRSRGRLPRTDSPQERQQLKG